jgi:hypothetical protein
MCFANESFGNPEDMYLFHDAIQAGGYLIYTLCVGVIVWRDLLHHDRHHHSWALFFEPIF